MSDNKNHIGFTESILVISSWYVIPGITVAVHYYGDNPTAFIVGGICGILTPVTLATIASITDLVGISTTTICDDESKLKPNSIITSNAFGITLGLLGCAAPFIMVGCSFWGSRSYFI